MANPTIPTTPIVNPPNVDCGSALPEAALRGLQHFNAHQYFAAHEELETAWRNESGPQRELYRGILQLGVAYYHLTRGNITGARKLLNSSRNWLSVFPEHCQGINLKAVRLDIQKTENMVANLPAESHPFFDPYQFNLIEFDQKSEEQNEQ